MTGDDEIHEPSQSTPAGVGTPVPEGSDWERTVERLTEPSVPDDVPDELEDAARQELAYPADETDEG
jgi:hypothetical protein